MFDIIIFALLVAAVVCSIIELGLTAYLVSSLNDYLNRYNARGGRFSSTYNYNVFASVWSLLVSVFLLVWGLLKRGGERVFAPLTLALNTITMIFWLAAFAAIADLYGGLNPTDEPGAALAFGVILWLIFLALTVINFLTAFGVIKSERVGHSPVFSRSGRTTTTTTTTV